VTRLRKLGFVAAALVVTASLVTPTLAWAKYRAAASETNVFATHVLLAPGTPTCGVISLLTVTLSWTPPSDSAYVDTYEVGYGPSAVGPFANFISAGTNTFKIISIPGFSTRYYVVHTTNDSWTGANSGSRRVDSLVALASCP
jgi:hypothetical protein